MVLGEFSKIHEFLVIICTFHEVCEYPLYSFRYNLRCNIKLSNDNLQEKEKYCFSDWHSVLSEQHIYALLLNESLMLQ